MYYFQISEVSGKMYCNLNAKLFRLQNEISRLEKLEIVFRLERIFF